MAGARDLLLPGPVHTDPPRGYPQALCGRSAQLVRAEITRDGAALLGSRRHLLPAIVPPGGPPEALLAGFPTPCAPPQTLGPGLAPHWEDRAGQHTHSPAYGVGGGASGHAHSPAAAPPPQPHPKWTKERTTVFTGKEMESSRCQSPFLLIPSQL